MWLWGWVGEGLLSNPLWLRKLYSYKLMVCH